MPNNDWYTPRWLVEALESAVGGIDIDPCSGCEPEPIAPTTYTKADDGLAQDWSGTVYVNPPYQRYVIDEWAEKIHDEATRPGGPDLILALLPARMSADWWNDYVSPADVLFVFTSRLRFGGADNDGGFASVLAAYGDVPPQLIETLQTTRTPAKVYEGHEIAAVWRAYRGDRIRVETDLRGAAAPDGVDTVAEATVETVSVSDDGLIEILAVQPAIDQDHETYFLIEVPEENPIDVRCSVARGIVDAGFRNVPISNVEPIRDEGPTEERKQATLMEVVA